jgi:hypothetical protein
MSLDVSGALEYESLSREALASRLSQYGIVLLVLAPARARVAERFLQALEYFRDLGPGQSRPRRLFRLLGGFGVILRAMFHPRLFALGEFFVLDRPAVWGVEPTAGERRLLRFQGKS